MRFLLSVIFLSFTCLLQGQTYSLRFYGNGVDDIDRVKIRIDDPTDSDDPSPPVDVGAADFTIEFWMKANAADNTSAPVACGNNNAWIYGNIIIDRDRYNQGRNYGISVAGGEIVFGTMGTFGDAYTLCSNTTVLDNTWHHIAVQRRRSDGWMWLYIDGVLEADINGPNGDISYPDDGVPGNFCGGPCTNSDPFIVFGAEKHDAGSDFPSYNGYLDEVRFSNLLRYSGTFDPPSSPFIPDANTVGLYRLETGSGIIAFDDSGSGSPNGQLHVGGNPQGPVWTTDDPFSVLAIDETEDTREQRHSMFAPCILYPLPATDYVYLDQCPDVQSVEIIRMDGDLERQNPDDERLPLDRIKPGYFIIRVIRDQGVSVFPAIKIAED